jgi:hypothetical protein
VSIPEKTYQQYLALVRVAEQLKEEMIPHATEVVRELTKREPRKFQFLDTVVRFWVGDGPMQDVGECSPALLFEPDWKAAVAQIHRLKEEGQREWARRCALKNAREKEQAEMMELVRLVSKYKDRVTQILAEKQEPAPMEEGGVE